MIFIDNKYTKIYYKIVLQSTVRVGYLENHHIIPKSLGGSNDPNNLIKLTPKEHYICHLLLRKMTTGNDRKKMVYALWAMLNLKNKYQTERITSRNYQKLKEEYSQVRKTFKHSEDTKKKISVSHKGKKLSEEHKKAVSNSRKGKATRPKGTKFSNEHRQNISKARLGKSWGYKHSNQTKAKMSAWQKGVQKEKHTCIHCGKQASLMNITRWHNDHCKHQ